MSKNTRYKLDPKELRDQISDQKRIPHQHEFGSDQKSTTTSPGFREGQDTQELKPNPGELQPFEMDTRQDMDATSTEPSAPNQQPVEGLPKKYNYKLKITSTKGGAEITLPRGIKEAKILQKLPYVDVCNLMSLVGDQGNYQRLIALNAVLVLFSASFAIYSLNFLVPNPNTFCG